MFLTGRTQVVHIKQSFSDPLEVISGVIQGSVIGPLLFLLYIDDMITTTSRETKVSLFADDAKVYARNPKILQSDINAICQFLDKRQLQLAPEKCQQITISKSSDKQDFYIGNHIVPHSAVVKDLGVTVSENLRWKEHINSIKLKASRRCNTY